MYPVQSTKHKQIRAPWQMRDRPHHREQGFADRVWGVRMRDMSGWIGVVKKIHIYAQPPLAKLSKLIPAASTPDACDVRDACLCR